MYIHLSCTACSQRIRVPAAHAGKLVRCPVCRATSPIPARMPSPAPVSTIPAEPRPPQDTRARTPSHLATQDGELLDDLPPPDLVDDAPGDDRKARIGFTEIDEVDLRANLISRLSCAKMKDDETSLLKRSSTA